MQAKPAEMTDGTESLLGNLASYLPPGESVRVETETVGKNRSNYNVALVLSFNFATHEEDKIPLVISFEAGTSSSRH